MMRYRIHLIIILILSFSVYSQMRDITLKSSVGTSKYSVRSMVKNNITWVSLGDLCQKASLKFTDNDKLLKKEIEFDKNTIIFSAYNPFVIIKDSEQKSYVYQMNLEVYKLNNEYYISVNDLEAVFNTSYDINSSRKSVQTGKIKQPDIKADVKTEKPKTTDEQPVEEKTTIPKTEDIVAETPAVREIKSGTSNYTFDKSLFDIFDFRIEEKANGYMLKIFSSKALGKVGQQTEKDFYYLNFSGNSIDTVLFTQKFPTGLFSSVYAKQAGKDARVKLGLRYPVENVEITRSKGKNDVNILFFLSAETMKKISKVSQKIKESKENSILDVVVIDPGHGGKDGGATGYRGTLEKNVNLSIGLKVGSLIKKYLKSVKVVYTRNDDRFIELYRRGQIANENKGDLFISIHCNSSPKRPGTVSGSEIYLLRPGRTEESIKIAEMENSVIKLEENYESRYKDLTDENFILVSMNQTANVKESEKFADILNKKFSDHLKIDSKGVKQAGFYVLVGASMPSVLIETGYLNHPEDERYLSSEEGQNEIAVAIFKAISEYKKAHDELVINN